RRSRRHLPKRAGAESRIPARPPRVLRDGVGDVPARLPRRAGRTARRARRAAAAPRRRRRVHVQRRAAGRGRDAADAALCGRGVFGVVGRGEEGGAAVGGCCGRVGGAKTRGRGGRVGVGAAAGEKLGWKLWAAGL
ncbi:hypothetical protein LTR16_012427, partial [Cryomyces antarcticus]